MAADNLRYFPRDELYMDESEIVKEYYGAKNKREQVIILSQLNLCPREQILRVLITNGVDVSPVGASRYFGTCHDKTFCLLKRVCVKVLTDADASDQNLANVMQSMKLYMEAASKKPKNRRRTQNEIYNRQAR